MKLLRSSGSEKDALLCKTLWSLKLSREMSVLSVSILEGDAWASSVDSPRCANLHAGSQTPRPVKSLIVFTGPLPHPLKLAPESTEE